MKTRITEMFYDLMLNIELNITLIFKRTNYSADSC